MSQSKVQQVLALARKTGVLRSKDAETYGIHREYLRRLEQQGLLIRSARGIYTLLENNVTEHHSLVEASQRVPHGIVCLLSALRFHQITTQAPFEVWLAIHGKAHLPREALLPLHIVYMSGNAFQSGIETHRLEGIPVQIYSLPKTVADCFKYRNKIGLDVALEALRESWRDRCCTMDELWHYAKICRVNNVMRPYLESLV
ncbi:MAG: type IV toxin-antitoxin system AbiEi family antitoxin domain-containing protein [Thermosynechococcaceae cyanobacterium]